MSASVPVNLPRRIGAVLIALVLFGALAASASASAEKVGPPSRITVLGDSISRGFNSQGSGCIAGDCTANNWATGSNSGPNSYLTRLKQINPAAVASAGGNGNHAASGAKMTNLNGQALNAIPTNPDLVLILMGANDVCTSSVASMTSVATYRAQFAQAMQTLSSNLPDARIQVMSIPNIYNLWDVLKGNATARLIWGLGSICQSMLASPTSTATADVNRRNTVRQRNIDFNTQLKEVCAEYIHCRYDNGAAFNLTFVAGDVSTLDYFHPNTNGQAKAAAVAWSSTFNYSDLTAPTTTIERDRVADGVDDWYRDDVTVTLSSDAGDYNGSEYYYKLVGALDKPWTKYTGPFTISDEGETEVVARSVDASGNIESSKSDTIKIDKTAPTFVYTCTSSLLNGSPEATISFASDDRSGFAADPNGTSPLPSDEVGHLSSETQIADKAGNTTSHSCEYDVTYAFGGVQQPINADGSSVFKLGSTVPVKFKLADANAAAQGDATARITVAQISGTVIGTEVEATSTAASTTGNLFRYDADAQQYIFNLGTKSLAKGSYQVKITLDDGTSHTVTISLK